MNAPSKSPVETEAQVLCAIRGAVATVTLNRPERRNALLKAANIWLHGLWEMIDRDPATRAVVLTSADCGTFCAGMDLKEAAEVRQATGWDILDLLIDPFYERMRRVQVPIAAAITGHFTAAGMVLAANSDLREGLAGTCGGITEARVGRGTPPGCAIGVDASAVRADGNGDYRRRAWRARRRTTRRREKSSQKNASRFTTGDRKSHRGNEFERYRQ